MKIRLRTKLAIFGLTFAIIPLSIVVIPSILRFESLQRDTAVERQGQIATHASQEISNFTLEHFNRLDEVSLFYPEIFADEDLGELLVERVLFNNRPFVSVSLVNESGQEIVHKHQRRLIPDSDLRDMRGMDRFQAVTAEGYYLSDLHFDAATPLLTMGAAIIDSRNIFRGAVFAEVDARTFQNVVREIALESDEVMAYVVDDTGTLIAHPNISEVLAGRDYSSYVNVSTLLENPDGSYDQVYTSPEGDDVLGAWAPIEVNLGNMSESRWYVVTEEKASFALRHVDEMKWFTVAAFALVFVATGISVIIVTRKIVGPLEEVHRAVIRIGRGDFKRKLNVSTQDEIEELANGVNAMTTRLRESFSLLEKEKLSSEAEKNKLSLILAGISDAVIALDENKRVLTINQSALSMLGYKPKDINGKHIDEVMNVYSGENEVSSDTYCSDSKSGGNMSAFKENELRVVGKNKGELFVNFIAGRVRRGDPTGVSWILTLHDTTRQAQINRMHKEFVSIAAHQLRTPLSALKWVFSLLLDGDNENMTAKQREMFKKGQQSTERMIRLVYDLLNVSRIEDGRFNYNYANFDLADLFKDIATEFNERSEEMDFKFMSNVNNEVQFYGDKDKIRMAVANLLDNSFKYTPEGGHVELDVSLRGGKLVAVIKDSGIGIDSDKMDHLFDKFYRSQRAIEMDTEGSGLGLFISKVVIEHHEGTIDIDSEVNEGTTITMTFPLEG